MESAEKPPDKKCPQTELLDQIGRIGSWLALASWRASWRDLFVRTGPETEGRMVGH